MKMLHVDVDPGLERERAKLLIEHAGMVERKMTAAQIKAAFGIEVEDRTFAITNSPSHADIVYLPKARNRAERRKLAKTGAR